MIIKNVSYIYVYFIKCKKYYCSQSVNLCRNCFEQLAQAPVTFVVIVILSLFGEPDHFCSVHLSKICLNTDLRLEISPHYLLFIQ